MSTIELLGISKQYGGEVAVAPTDLHIAEGELVTLLGPSGSGKSTILSMIAGITPPTTGQIRIDARDVTHVPPAQRNLGMVFQSYALFPHLCVFDNVAFPLSIRGLTKAQIADRVVRVLTQVQLDESLYARRPSALSGGQQQRVALARALVFNPDILLLDEPMGALDKKLREEVQIEIKQLQQELGVTTLMVTHDQEEALSMSTRVVVLNKGQVQQIAAPDQAYREPANRFVADFMGSANWFVGEVRQVNSQWQVLSASGTVLPCRPGLQVDGAVHVMVRPEHLRVHAHATPERLQARVSSRVYLGQTTRVHLQTVAGQTLIALLREDGSAPLHDNQIVHVDWHPAHGWGMPV